MKVDCNLPGPLVSKFRRELKIGMFIETGTGGGDTTELAAMAFDRVLSCEIDPRLVHRAKDRLAPYPNVTVTTEPSPEFLRREVPLIDQPVMYWLDAHWSGGPLKPERECPLLEELQAIGSLGDSTIILIDDAELFINPPARPHDPTHWPTILQITNLIDSWNEPYHYEWHINGTRRVLAVVPGEVE